MWQIMWVAGGLQGNSLLLVNSSLVEAKRISSLKKKGETFAALENKILGQINGYQKNLRTTF